jgi:ribosomal protein L40E
MYSESALESVRCPKCGDKNLKAKKQAAKVDYYTTGKEDK